MKENSLKELHEMLEKMIDERGEREAFEKFKKEHEHESPAEILKGLLEGLEETLEKGKMKPNFFIKMRTYKDREGYSIEVKGNRPSIMTALAELSGSLLEKSNLSKSDILRAVKTGLESAEED